MRVKTPIMIVDKETRYLGKLHYSSKLFTTSISTNFIYEGFSLKESIGLLYIFAYKFSIHFIPKYILLYSILLSNKPLDNLINVGFICNISYLNQDTQKINLILCRSHKKYILNF